MPALETVECFTLSQPFPQVQSQGSLDDLSLLHIPMDQRTPEETLSRWGIADLWCGIPLVWMKIRANTRYILVDAYSTTCTVSSRLKSWRQAAQKAHLPAANKLPSFSMCYQSSGAEAKKSASQHDWFVQCHVDDVVDTTCMYVCMYIYIYYVTGIL